MINNIRVLCLVYVPVLSKLNQSGLVLHMYSITLLYDVTIMVSNDDSSCICFDSHTEKIFISVKIILPGGSFQEHINAFKKSHHTLILDFRK